MSIWILIQGCYDVFKGMITPAGGDVKNLAAWRTCTAAGASGFVFWFLTYPNDVIKSTIQSDALIRSERKYNSTMDCVKKLYRNEGGFPRFFRGILSMSSQSYSSQCRYVVHSGD